MTMFRELLIEIGCEELPASWLPVLTDQLNDRLGHFLSEARLEWKAPIQSFCTPRRLVVHAARVAAQQADLKETVSGPPVRAAFDADGEPTAAALGFAAKQGVDVSRLQRANTPKGKYLVYKKHQRGVVARKVLPNVMGATLRALSFPKQMNWDAQLADGRGELVFGRPIRWILFLYGGRVVPFRIQRQESAATEGVTVVSSGSVTYGHRFFSRHGQPGRAIRVGSFSEYKRALASGYVVIDREVRRRRIMQKLERAANRAGG